MKAADVILVNNTCDDLRMFDAVLIDCVRNNKVLPEELADLITLEVIEVDGESRGIIEAA